MFIYTSDELDPVDKKVASTIKDDDIKLSLENKIDKSELLTDQHDEDHGGHEGHEHHEGDHHGGYAPHIWLDTHSKQRVAKKIKTELNKKDPDHQSNNEENEKKIKN